MKKYTHISPVFILSFLFLVQLTFAKDSEFYIRENIEDDKVVSSYEVKYLGEDSGVSLFDFTGSFDKNVDGQINIEARKSVTEDLFLKIPDQYDFVVIFTKFPVDSEEASAFAISYQNDVLGIGIPLFNNSLTMGSERLQATIDMTELSNWELNPANSLFDSTLDILIHEMMHRWGIRVNFLDQNLQSSDLLRGRDDNHWSYFAHSSASVLYGAAWQELSPGLFETKAVSKSLSPLDLYLMGIKEADSVPDFFFIDSGVPGDRLDLPSPLGTRVNGERINVSIQDIISAEGVRIPSSKDSQHQFNFKFVLLKRPGDEFEAEELGKLLVLQREFQKRFFVETGGIGEIVYPMISHTLTTGDPLTLEYNVLSNFEFNLYSAEDYLINMFDTEEKSWGDKSATQVRDTAMSLKTLNGLNQTVIGADASEWINTLMARNNDELAWLLLSDSLNSNNRALIIDQLLSSVNNDGGWGFNTGSESSAYDTALVLYALKNGLGDEYNATTNTLMYVLSQVNDDGGIGFTSGGKSSLMSSAMMLYTFYDLTQNSTLEQTIIDFIIQQQLDDHGWGSSESSVHETALVIDALSQTHNQSHLQAVNNAKSKLSTMQSVDGSFEGSVYSTAIAIQVLLNDQKPNLSLSSVDLVSNQAIEGEQVAFEYEISHQGGLPMLGATVDLVLNQEVVSSAILSSIQPNETITGKLILDSNGLSGELRFDFVVDYLNSIAESNEFDNEISLALEVQPQSPQPELAFDQSSVIFQPDYYDSLPFNFTASFNVENLSTTDLTDVKVSLIKDTKESNQIELESYVSNIKAGQDRMYNFNFQFDEADNGLALAFFIDPLNEIIEVNEENNILQVNLKKVETIDLVTSVPQVTLPSEFVLGQQLPVTFGFGNLGTQLSPGFDVKVIYHGSNDSQILYENHILEMRGGENIERQFSWIPSELGDFSLEFIVDEGNSVAEINENNNIITIPMTVVSNTSTNLLLENDGITISPDPGLTGQTLNLTILVKNTSSSPSGLFDLNLYQQQTGEAKELLESLVDIQSIPAGSERAITTQLDTYNQYGDVTFIVAVDPDNKIIEFNENDNLAFNSFRIYNKPDAMVSTGGFSLTPSVPVLGSAINVEVVATNLGEQDLVNLELKLFSKSNEVLIEIDSIIIPLIEIGQTESTNFDFVFPNDPTISQLVLVADAANSIDEINESNNQATLTISNQSREFYVTETHFSPNGDGIKDDTQVVFNLEFPDDYQVKIYDDFNQIIREFIVFNNTSFGDLIWDGRDHQQKVVRDAVYRIEIKGLNSLQAKSLSVVVDNNRTTLLEAIKYDEGIFFDLGCSLDSLNTYTVFSPDGMYIYTHNYTDKHGAVKTGLFRIKTDGTKIESLLPNDFNNKYSYIPSKVYHLTKSGEIILYLSVIDTGISEIWRFNPITKALNKLDTPFSDQFTIELSTDHFSLVKVYQNSNYQYYKVPHDNGLAFENLPFSSDGNVGLRIKKLIHGWSWGTPASNDLYNIYYSLSENTASPQLLASNIELQNFNSSEDGSYLSIYSKSDSLFRYFQVGENQLSTVLDHTFNNQLVDVYTRILLSNTLLQINALEFNIFDSSGHLVVSEPHPFNLNYFQQQVIAQFGSLDSMLLRHEAGSIEYSFSELENLEVEFNDLQLSQAGINEIYLKFSANLVGDLDLSAYGYSNEEVTIFSDDTIQLRLDYRNLEDVEVAELENIDVKNPYLYESLSPFFDMGGSSYMKIFQNDEYLNQGEFWSDFNIKSIFPDISGSDHIKKARIFSYSMPIESSCTNLDGWFNGVFQSKANLTAFLKAEVKSNVVELSGSAFDQYFDHYVLQWKDMSQINSTWQTIKSSDMSVENDFLMYWTPTEAGNYQIRLTVYDQAGNHHSDTDQIYINDVNLNVRNPSIYPEYFSPNGDGIQDEFFIEYEVLQTSDVILEIKNSSAEVVRTITKEYLSSQWDTVVWDGLNDMGQSLPDDYYTVSFNNYAYQVLLDVTPPEVLYFRAAKSQEGMAYNWPLYPWSYGFRTYWKVDDAFTDSSHLSQNSYTAVFDEDTQNWLPEPSYSCSAIFYNDFIYDINLGQKYRCQTYDLAGNPSNYSELTVQLDPIYIRELVKPERAPNLSVYYTAFKCPKDFGSLKEAEECDDDFVINQTVHPRVTDWGIEGDVFLTLQPFSNQEINQIKMTTSYTPVDTADPDPEPIVAERYLNFADKDLILQQFSFSEDDLVQLDTDATGMLNRYGFKYYFLQLKQSYFPETDAVISTVFEFLYENGDTHEVEFKISFKFGSLEKFSSANDLFTKGVDKFWDDIKGIINNNSEHLKLSLAQIFDSIEFDSNKQYWLFIKTASENITNPVVIEKQFNQEQIQYSPIFSIHHLPDNLDVGHEIQLFETQGFGCQIPAITYLGLRENDSLIEIKVSNGFIAPFCLDNIQIKQSFYAGAQCDEFASIDDLIRLNVSGLIGQNTASPASLEIYRLVEGVEDVILVETNLTFEVNQNGMRVYEISVEFDKSDFAAGQQYLFFRFKDIEGNEYEESELILIQDQAVNSSIIKPYNHQKFCATDTEVGGIKVPVQLVFDNNGKKNINASQFINGVLHKDLLNLSSLQKPTFDSINSTDILTVDTTVFEAELPLDAHYYTGESSIVFNAINSSGVSQCQSVVVEVDSLVEVILDVPQLLYYLSPIGTGDLSSVEFASVVAQETLQVKVDVFRLEHNQTKTFLGILYEESLNPSNQVDLSWSGELSGQLLPDGEYELVIEVKDDCEILRLKTIDVIIDNIAPQLSFSSPIDNQLVGSILEISALIDEINLDESLLELSYQNNGVWTPLPIETLVQSIAGNYELLSVWNLAQLSSNTYPLRVKAKDLAGNESELLIQIVLDEPLNLIWDYHLSHRYFSPNNDFIIDQTNINLGLNLQSLVSIQVLDQNQVLIKQLADELQLPQGSHDFIWDGLDSMNQVVIDGEYEIKTILSEVGNPVNTGLVSLNVTVDNAIPMISFVPESSVVKGEGDLSIVVTEQNLNQLQAWLQPIDLLESETLVLESNSVGELNLVSLPDLNEANYQVRLSISDLAGNQFTSLHSFEVDNTRPILSIANPLNLSYQGGFESLLSFSGEVSDKNLSQYEFSISPNIEPFQWTVMFSGIDVVNNELINEWPIPETDGDYVVKGVAVDHAAWETETVLEITVDTSPPTAVVVNPELNSLQGNAIDITGTVNDEYLDYYSISYKDKNWDETQWALIYSAIQPVFNDRLFLWNHDLESGEYELRITAADKVGLITTVTTEFVIDSEPPLAPLFLEAEIVNQQNVNLSWVDSESTDIIGYWVMRNNLALNQTLLTQTHYQDLAVPEGVFTYWVLAVDGVGNYSAPSNAQIIQVDLTGPEVFIQSPTNGQLVSGVIDLKGTAHSAEDFYGYHLYFREQGAPLPGVMLSQSSLPILGQQMAELDTRTLNQGTPYLVRLEARDILQNVSFVEHSFQVDNTAPSAPINLSYQLNNGNNVVLSWNANSETDLAGYLVYRNGVIISGNGTVQSSITTSTTFLDVDVVDGLHNYFVTAVDLANNISAVSNEVDVSVDMGPPHAYFTDPVNGKKFESTLWVEASSDDIDVLSVLFEYSIDGMVWNTLSTEQNIPYKVALDAPLLGLNYGFIELKATATDTNSQVDPSPDLISVEYTDLTPPDSITEFTGLVSGGDIQLSWLANSESDLAGYIVSRKRTFPDPELDFTVLTDPLITSNQYLDSALADGSYIYRISAVDTFNNQGMKTDSTVLSVYSIELLQPYSPLLYPADLTVVGLSDNVGEVLGQLINESGNQSMGPVGVDNEGVFEFNQVELMSGDNHVNVFQQNNEGHSSRVSNVSVQLSSTPLIPINPVAEMTGYELSFTWESPDNNTLGYLPYINQQPVYPVLQVTDNLYPYASSYPYYSNRAVDGDLGTSWVPSYTDITNGIPVYMQVLFQGSKWISKVDIHWSHNNAIDEEVYKPNRYMLQFLSPVGWITQHDYSGNENADVSFENDVPYWTEGVRIWMPLEAGVYQDIRLSEIEIWQQPLVNQTEYMSTLPDGTYDFQVSAINQYGFESALTVAQNSEVGDVVSPETVILTGQVQNGNQVKLDWSASASSDVSSYRLYRDDGLIVMTSDATTLNYLDLGLTNGIYHYYVTAVDSAGNISFASNEVLIEVLQQLLDPPVGLSVTAENSGSVLNLVWDEITDTEFSHYVIYRSLSANNGFELLRQQSTVGYVDDGLINGIRYYYYIIAVDQIGNESLSSDVVTGIPLDLSPPIQPVITAPTVSGVPININDLTILISGQATPGSEVDLYQNNNFVDTVFASSLFTQNIINYNRHFSNVRYNSKNNNIALSDFNIGEVLILDPDSEVFTSLVGAYPHYYFWNKQGDKLYGIDGYYEESTLKSFNIAGEEIATLISGFNMTQASVSEDESQILYKGDGINPDTSQIESGLWLYSTDSQMHMKIDVGLDVDLHYEAIEWLPNGDVAFINLYYGYGGEGELLLLNSENGQLQLIEASTAGYSNLSINDDGTHLFYVITVNGNQAIKRYRLSDGNSIIYAKPGIDVSSPIVKRDPNLLLVNVEGNGRTFIDIMTDEAFGQFDNIHSSQSLTWLDDNRIMYFNNEAITYIIPPGLFDFHDVNLMPGLNEFHVISRKANGQVSPSSESIKVLLNEAVLSDLEVKHSYLQVAPEQVFVGQSTTATVLVKNTSQVDVDQARLMIELIDPELNTQIIEPAPLDFSLPANDLLVENFNINNLNSLGEYVIRVVVDSNQQVLETNEDNNTVYKTIHVIDDLIADVDVVLSSNEVLPGDDLNALLRIYNPGSIFSGRVLIRITDVDGFSVGFEQSYLLTELNTAQIWEQSITWNSDQVFAGSYQIEVSLYDQNHLMIEQKKESFVVSELASFDLSLATTSAQVLMNQTVNLLVNIQYQIGNVNQSGTLTWEVVDENQQLIWSYTQSTNNMLPGFNGTFEKAWTANQVGYYQASIRLDTPLINEIAVVPFEVIGSTSQLNLSGQINPLSTAIILGQVWNTNYSIHNNGQINVSDIDVTLALWSSDLSQLLYTDSRAISLSVGSDINLMSEWDTSSLELASYVLVLTADLSEFGDSAEYLLDTQTIQAIDVNGPEITVINPVEQGYYKSSLELRTEIFDKAAEVEFIEVRLDGILVANLSGQRFNNVYQHWLTELSEGAHQLELNAIDIYGNSNSQSVNFNVDNTPPNISVLGVIDGGLYNSSVQANLTFTDLNLSSSHITLDGLPFQSGDYILLEGSHILMATAIDLAGNSVSKRVSFNIDLTPPMVVVNYPINDSETNQNNTIVSGHTEANASLTLINGAYINNISADFEGNFSFINVPLISGLNTISISATDLAGNVGSDTMIAVNFVDNIDLNGMLEIESPQPLAQNLSVDWQITNQSNFTVSQLSLEVNLYRVSDNQLMTTDTQNLTLDALATLMSSSLLATNGLSPSDYRIELRVEINAQWQILDVLLMSLQDTDGPEVIVVEPVQSQLTQSSVDILVLASDIHSQVTEVSYQLNNSESWLPLNWNGIEYSTQIEVGHGEHQIIMRALDTFGNETITAAILFSVDTNGPLIEVIAPSDGLMTNQAVVFDFNVTDDHSFTVDAQSNQVIINTGDTIDTEGEYQLVINALDEVNNQSVVIRNFIIDTTVPILTVSNPSIDTQNTTGLLDIIGQAEEMNFINVSVNGIETILKTDSLGRFIKSGTSLQLGMNVIVVTATDQAGNVSQPQIRNVEYIQVASVTGRVWQDDNQDSNIDIEESGLSQVTLRLTGNNNAQEVHTDENGFYVFNDLNPGQYSIEVIDTLLLKDWINTTNNTPLLLEVIVDENLEVHFGFYQADALIENTLLANNINGRLLLLVDPPTAQVDTNLCVGVADFHMQKFIAHKMGYGDTVWAKLYDSQGVLLQTETASHEEFVNNGFQIIDQYPETSDFNLVLFPVINSHLKAGVLSSSMAVPTVLPTEYRLTLGLQILGESMEWSSELVTNNCQVFTSIGSQLGELRLSKVGLNPPLVSDDPNSSSQVLNLSSQYVMLENILIDAGWSYQITSNVSEFETEMNSGQYVAYWLMAENLVLSPQSQTNLMTAVSNGAGIVVSSGHDNLTEEFYSSMGINIIGNHFSAAELVMIDSPITESKVLDVLHDEQALKISLAGAQSAATLSGAGIVAPENQALAWLDIINSNNGINKSSVISALDLLLQAAADVGMNQYAELIKNILKYIHPLGLSNELGYARAVRFNMKNYGRAVNGYVQVLLPPSLRLVQSPVPITLNQDGFTFEYDLLENQFVEYEFWLQVDASPATLTFEVHLNNEPNIFESIDLSLIAGERPDLSTSLTNCQSGVDPDQSLKYVYQIRNTGNTNITAATAFTDFGNGLQNPVWTCAGYLGGVCGESNGIGNLQGQVLNLPVGSHIDFVFETQVLDQPTLLMPSGLVMMPEEMGDINPGNNSAVDVDEVYRFIFKNTFECVSAGNLLTKNQVNLTKEER